MSDQPQQFQDEERMDKPSASSFEIVVRCPGQPAMKKALPPEALKQKQAEPDPDAERGTRIHKALETGNALELDDEETDTYNLGLKYEAMIIDAWKKDFGLKDVVEGPRELRIFLNDPNTLEPIASCKLDKHYFSGDRLLVIDFKSGWNPNLPPSPKSWQLRFQAVALWQEMLDRNIVGVRVAHCKPKMSCGSEDVCDYTVPDLQNSLSSIYFHLWESKQPDAPRHAGVWCNWCPCIGNCVEAGAYSVMPIIMARKVQRSKDMPWEMMVQKMSTADLVRIWEASTTVEKIINAAKSTLKARSTEELAKFGICLGKPRPRPSINDVPTVFAFLMKQFPGKAREILMTMDFGKTAIQQFVGKEFGMTKEDAKRWVDSTLKPWIVVEESEKPLAKIK